MVAFAFQLATPKAQADLAEAISPFLSAPAAPQGQPAPPVQQPPLSSLPTSESAALLAQPRMPMAQTLLAQRMQQSPLAQGTMSPASFPAFSVPAPQAQGQQAQRFAVGGLATSLREDPEDHSRDQDAVDTRNQQMLALVGHPAPGSPMMTPQMALPSGSLAVMPRTMP
jgi:hypothetical protein